MSRLLIKFINKSAARAFLRINSLLNSKRSSLYKIGNNYYLLVDSSLRWNDKDLRWNNTLVWGHDNSIWNNLNNQTITNPELIAIPEVEVITRFSTSEELLVAWANGELEQNIQFIEFEMCSTAKQNSNQADYFIGRIIIHNSIEIIRTFEPLFDIMAVINYTSDSFSDGGNYGSSENMARQIMEQVNAGATIIDLGVESTRPNAKILTGAQEIEILQEVLPEVITLKQQYAFSLSIDTYHDETVNWLLETNIDFDIINDVSGNINIQLVKRIIEQDKKYIAMHSLSIPADLEQIISLKDDPIEVVNNFFAQKMEQFLSAAISLDKIMANVIFDPGLGFGKNAAQSWFILNNASKINTLGAQLLLGHSRKSFFNNVTNKKFEQRDIDSAFIAVQLANLFGIMRIHDTIATVNLYALKSQLTR